jgi:hypothetical protein
MRNLQSSNIGGGLKPPNSRSISWAKAFLLLLVADDDAQIARASQDGWCPSNHRAEGVAVL